MRLAVATLVALFAFASPAVASQVTIQSVDIGTPSAATGARTVYRVALRTTAGPLTGADTLRVALPAGTGITGWQGGTLRDVTRGVDVGSCGNPGAGLASSCGLFTGQSIPAGNQVLVTLRGLTNGPVGTTKTVQVDSTDDADPATSPNFSVVAGNSIGTPAVAIADPSAAAGARTRYVTTFTVSNTGGLSAEAGSQITVTLPAGTTSEGWQGGVVHDVTRNIDVGSCSNPGAGVVSTCGFFSSQFVNAGDQLRITLRGLTNGSTGTTKTVGVSTTSDTPTIPSSQFSIVTGGSVTMPAVTINSPSAATGARTRYMITFNVSGGLSAEAGSEITVLLPPGTTAPGWQGGVVRDVTRGVDVGSCSNPAATEVSTCGFFSSQFVNAGDQLQITLRGLTNGTVGTAKVVQVSTTSDLPTIRSSEFAVVAGNSITQPQVVMNSPSAGAGARTRYAIRFTVSNTGGLSAEAGSQLTVNLPTGTTAPGWQGGVVHVEGRGDVGTCSNPAATLVSTCGLFSASVVNAGETVTITLRGITNGAAGTGKTARVSTTSDLPEVTSAPFDIANGSTVTQPAVTIANPSAAAGARTRYVTTFNVSGATGGMSAEAGSQITVNLPAGTTAPKWQGGLVEVVNRGDLDVGTCSNPGTTRVATCGFFSGAFVNSGDTLRITLRGLTNPTTGAKTLDVFTTSDLPTVISSGFTVVPGNSLSFATVKVGTTAPLARTPYVVDLKTSTTGGLSAEAGSEITLTFPSGTGFTDFQSGTIHDVERGVNVGICGSRTGLVLTCGFFSGAFVNAGDQLRISFPGITNPAAGPYTLTATTSSDTPTVTSSNYTTDDAITPETTVEGNGPYVFSSTEPGSTFECSIDGGEFLPCTSPFTPPPLEPGEHSLRVRAVDATGNPDPSPAVTSFVVEQPPPQPTVAPTPTPTPTPEPTPQFNQTVVVEPAGGTVQVCPKGGKCFTLAAGQTIPMGSTVDTKKGAVELTSVSAPGAPKQTAVFSEGIFRITQRGTVTELTLTEKLAPCPKKKARAAAKKPKSRKLWGKGSGKFRTVGNYSAATVRGTRWLTQDSCAGTLTRVTEGVVAVSVRKKLVIVRAGKSYLARPR